MNDKELASKLFRVVSEYNPEGLKMVKKAYEMAYEAHDGQKRKTGEPYIIHPIWVALILTDLKVDTDTLCAALLHDTVEDTNITLEKIEKEFNKEANSFSMSSVFMFTPYNITYMRFFQLDT